MTAAACRACVLNISVAIGMGVASVPFAAAAQTGSLRRADVRMAIDPPACDVEIDLTIDGDSAVAILHRLLLYEGAIVEGLRVTGPVTFSVPVRSGASLTFAVSAPAGPRSYRVQYTVMQPERWADRCPIWLPEVAADGAGRAVHITVDLPPGRQPLPDVFPALVWDAAGRGTATLGHMPALVRVGTVRPGERVGWMAKIGRGRLIDAAALLALAGGSGLWVAWRRARRQRTGTSR